MDAKAEIEKLLKSRGAILVRWKKHRVWRLPNGRKWVTPNTPSDSSAWKNNLGELRLSLGLKASDKTQLDFAHVKKEGYEKKSETPTAFLEGLPEREDRPVVPVSPSPLDWSSKEPERETISMYGKVPRSQIKKYRKSESGRCGAVFTYSAAVKAQASLLLETKGAKEMNDYLHQVRNGNVNSNGNSNSNVKEEVVETESAAPAERTYSDPLESALREQEGRIRHFTMVVEKGMLEVKRATEVAKHLRMALGLQTAPISSFRLEDKQQPTVNPVVVDADRKPKGYWKERILLALTSPVSLTRKSLPNEVLKEETGVDVVAVRPAVYAAVTYGLTAGWIFEDKDGFVRTKQEGA